MSETFNTNSSQSMKNLTDKVLKADLASRKKKMLSLKALKFSQVLMIPIAYYVVKVYLKIKFLF